MGVARGGRERFATDAERDPSVERAGVNLHSDFSYSYVLYNEFVTLGNHDTFLPLPSSHSCHHSPRSPSFAYPALSGVLQCTDVNICIVIYNRMAPATTPTTPAAEPANAKPVGFAPESDVLEESEVDAALFESLVADAALTWIP